VRAQESRDYDKPLTYDNEAVSSEQSPDPASSPIDEHGYLILIDNVTL